MSPEGWSAIADCVMAAAAVAAAITAFRGLHNWRSQETWREDSNLARRTLIATENYKQFLYATRHPAMFESEKIVPEGELQGLSETERRAAIFKHAYTNRWERMESRRAELNALLIEASAVWGDELERLFKPIFDLQHELFSVIYRSIRARTSSGEDSRSANKLLDGKPYLLYDMQNENDEFRRDFNQGIEPIIAYLRGKLGRKP